MPQTARECIGLKSEILVKMPPKTAAQYSREYRARKKAQKSFYVQKPTPKTPTERSREFRARKKALENAAKGHSTSSSSIIVQGENQQNSLSENLGIDREQQPVGRRSLKKKTKTPAERTRECRARKKALQNAMIERLLTSSSDNGQNDIDQTNSLAKNLTISVARKNTLKKKPKTPTERSRECRARKRALEKAMIEHLIVTPSAVIVQADVHQPNSLSEDLALVQKQNTQSEVLVAAQQQNTLSENEDVDQHQKDNLPECIVNVHPLMTLPENLPDVHQQNSFLNNNTANIKQPVDQNKTLKEKTKTPTERSREYRARQKALENAVKHLPSNILLDNDICVTFGS